MHPYLAEMCTRLTVSMVFKPQPVLLTIMRTLLLCVLLVTVLSVNLRELLKLESSGAPVVTTSHEDFDDEDDWENIAGMMDDTDDIDDTDELNDADDAEHITGMIQMMDDTDELNGADAREKIAMMINDPDIREKIARMINGVYKEITSTN